MAFIDDKEFEVIIQDKDDEGNWKYRESCGKGMKAYGLAVSACGIISKTMQRDCRVVQRFEREVRVYLRYQPRCRIIAWTGHAWENIANTNLDISEVSNEVLMELAEGLVRDHKYRMVKLIFKDGMNIRFSD